MRRISFWSLIFTCSILITIALSSNISAQVSPTHNLNPFSQQNSTQQNNTIGHGCVRLDGRCVLRVIGRKSALPQRINIIQDRLDEIARIYFQTESDELKVTKNDKNIIFVTIGNDTKPMVVAMLTPQEIRDQMASLERGLKQAKQQRKPEYLIEQAKIAGLTAGAMILLSLGIANPKNKRKQSNEEKKSEVGDLSEVIKTELIKQQKANLQAVKNILLNLARVAIWVGGTLFILGLFPYTKSTQFWFIWAFGIPLLIAAVILATYVIIRLSYAAIDKLNSTIANNTLLAYQNNQRLQLRIVTISVVAKSIITFSCAGIAVLVTLTIIGLDIGPILAGAGIIGIAVSFASQNFIKDTINGFLIILEDQYAVGDMINVGGYQGIVENINLRITQLRDTEGRLISIPNSEIKVVANLSSKWAQADLYIPVAYQTDVDKALKLIRQVAEQMSKDSNWKRLILEPPQVLGVENFGDRGVMIRVWIKTKPLQQWPVSREFRRRVKVAFDRAKIPIPMPQQEVLFKRYGSSSKPPLAIEGNKDDSQP